MGGTHRRVLIASVLFISLCSIACECSEDAATTTTETVAASSDPVPESATGRDGPRRRSPAELSPDERAKLLAAVPLIREGQRLGRAGDHAGALAAFEQALEQAPEHPGALCEAGWQAFHLDDLDRAKTLLEQGAKLSRLPNRRAACLYNLGRVYEARGLIAMASAQWLESLRLRPNDVVARRLSDLDAPEDSPDRESGQIYASIENFCAHFLDENDERERCGETNSVPFPGEGPSGALVFVDDAYQFYDWTYHRVALRTEAGLTFLALLGESEEHGYGSIGQDMTVEDVSIEQIIPGGKNEIILRVETQSWDSSSIIDAMWECRHRGLDEDGEECRRLMDEAGDTVDFAQHTVFGCAEMDGRWCCHAVGAEPTASDLEAVCTE